jgi:CsoR family transcriptional regulator, copper-sensing transcriptional repressor
MIYIPPPRGVGILQISFSGGKMKADKVNINRLLKTASGQIEGIIKMVEEDRYCIDISNQILAVQSILKKTNKEIIKAHMEMCVKEAFIEGNEMQKIEEVISLIDKISK